MIAELWRLTKAAAAGWWNDRAMSLGAAIAFFTIFSLAPILLAAISIAGLAFGREAAQGAIVSELSDLVGPEAATAIEAMIASASDVGSGIIGTAIGVMTFLLLATGAIVELQDDLNILEGHAQGELRGNGLHPKPVRELRPRRRDRFPAPRFPCRRRGALGGRNLPDGE